MTKIKFLLALRDRLSDLPEAEIEERLNFYSEMIEDRMEEGLSEDEAVAALGDVDDVAARILSESPAKSASEEKQEEKIAGKHKLSPGIIILLILGAPIWLSILASALSAVVSVYVSIWAIIVSFWAVFASLVGSAFGGIVSGAAIAIGDPLPGIAIIAAALILAGLSVFAFFGCKAATVGAVELTKLIVRQIKRLFTKKEAQ